MLKRVTLADVAREAGVSVQTASHVMAKNMTVRLPPATRERVIFAAEKVGYRPNRVAQAMRGGKTELIGVWIPLDRPILNYMIALREITQCVRASGYDLMIAGLDGQMAFSGEGRPPFNWPIDGLIAYDAGKAAGRFREDARNDTVPIAVIGLERYPNSDSVAWSLVETYRALTASLIEKGARDIVHITPQWIFTEYPREQRRRGYREAMEEAGLEPKIVMTQQETFGSSREAMAGYLASRSSPDVVMGFNDTLALGAADALLQHGCRIPQDCIVWGYGDYPETEFFPAPVSSIRVPIAATIENAWAHLLSRIEDPQKESKLTMLPMDLVIRE